MFDFFGGGGSLDMGATSGAQGGNASSGSFNVGAFNLGSRGIDNKTLYIASAIAVSFLLVWALKK